MSQLDYAAGIRYAADVLDKNAVKPLEVLVAGLQDWRMLTAHHMTVTANSRISDGINPHYHQGIIDFAKDFVPSDEKLEKLMGSHYHDMH